MKVKYDKENDVLYIKFSDAQVSESDEERKGIILDFDSMGNITGIEIINASKSIVQPSKLEYEVA
jgi:uncharacterized protein YuzE